MGREVPQQQQQHQVALAVELLLDVNPYNPDILPDLGNYVNEQVNYSSGRYFSGKTNDTESRLPFDYGFEAVGIIAAVGDSVTNLQVGTQAAIMTFGSYAEFTLVPSKHILLVERPDPEVVAMLTSGLTASIALEKAGQMESGKVVLVLLLLEGLGNLQSRFRFKCGKSSFLYACFFVRFHRVYGYL